MNYQDEFYTDDFISTLARARLYVSENAVSVLGHRIPFLDLTTFVVKKNDVGYTWVPKFLCKQMNADDKEVDMLFPLLIGGVELFCSRSYNSTEYIQGYKDHLKNKILDCMSSMFEDVSSRDFLNFKLPTTGDHIMTRTAKYFRSKFTPHQGYVDDILQHLSVLNILNKQAFYEELVALLDMCCAFLSDFAVLDGAFMNKAIYKPVDPGIMFATGIQPPTFSGNAGKIANEAVSTIISNAISKVTNYVKSHGAVHVSLKGMDVQLAKCMEGGHLSNDDYNLSELFITDCTSFCMGLFATLSYYLCVTDLGKQTVENQFGMINEEILNRYLNECLGKDMLARYFRRGFESKKPENSYNAFECGDIVLGDTGVLKTAKDGNSFAYGQAITRHEIEMAALVKSYFSGQKDVIFTLSDSFKYISGSYYGVRFFESVNMLANSLLELVDRNYCNELSDQKDDLKEKLERRQHAKKQEVKVHVVDNEAELKKIAELSSELDRKSAQVERLLAENEALSQMLADMRADDEIEISADDSADLSTDEIINYLNAFSIFFVGGRWDMKDRLNEMGLVNIYQANKVSAESGIPSSCDYLCNMTSFMSHTLYFKYKSSGIASPDNTYNFKGTNLDKLLRALYFFVKSREAERDELTRT